jgi:hypothetical protein
MAPVALSNTQQNPATPSNTQQQPATTSNNQVAGPVRLAMTTTYNHEGH